MFWKLILGSSYMIRLGLFGFGIFGQKIFEKLPKGSQVDFIFKRNRDTSTNNLCKTQNINLFTKPNELSFEKIDWVIIATPTDSHSNMIKLCLNKQVNIFCEKPLTNSYQQTKIVILKSIERNIKLYIDDVFLYRQGYKFIKEKMKHQQAQKISFEWKKYGTFEGNILENLAYHDFYLLVDIIGYQRKIEDIKIILSNKDQLVFSLTYSGILCTFDYDRKWQNSSYKKMTITSPDNTDLVWKNTEVFVSNKLVFEESTKYDALASMLQQVFTSKVDFSKNNNLALAASLIMKKLKHNLKLSNVN